MKGRKRNLREMERRFRIDLTEIEGDGEFLCPTCGAKISPDDYSGMTYNILETKTKEDGTLEEVIVQCRECESMICLEGFDLLEEVGCSRVFRHRETLESLIGSCGLSMGHGRNEEGVLHAHAKCRPGLGLSPREIVKFLYRARKVIHVFTQFGCNSEKHFNNQFSSKQDGPKRGMM